MKKIMLIVLAALALSRAAQAADDLAAGFTHPPEETKPWCYWYWISDNVSKAGITHDLEAMARVGIGEALIGNIVDESTPPGNVHIFTPQWWEATEHAVREGARLGVKIGLFNSPGWSQSGGPWVTATQTMRYVVSAETHVTGPQHFSGKLPTPKMPFQDIAVLAFPAPAADSEHIAKLAPRVQCAPAVAAAQLLCDGNPDTGIVFPKGTAGAAKPLSVTLETEKPFTTRSLALYPHDGEFAVNCELQAADTNGVFHAVREFSLDRRGPAPDHKVNVGPMIKGPAVVAFAPVTARKFRLVLTGLQGKGGLAEIDLAGAARLDWYVDKQLGKMHPTPNVPWDCYRWPAATEPDQPALAITPEHIINLSDKLAADGTLAWDVPAGEWIILRSGMTPTGAVNHPTTNEGRGPEVDKMNRAAITAHFRAMVGKLAERMPAGQRTALQHVVIDSYEVGPQNWTDGFTEQFRKTMGYDPRPWLPVLTGRMVGTAEQSDRFLWDLRRLVADRVAYDYVGGLRDAAHEKGLRLWLENYGHWGYPAEFLQYGGQSDDVAGEFWMRGTDGVPDLGSIELRAASSSAHLYGKRVVHAEAFTSPRSFRDYPADIKALGDWAYCQGINHFVLHVYIHQPWEDRKPGVNAWFGTEFNRHNTWFEQAKSWVDYLRRCHFLLQHGHSVADVAYFIGEDAPKMTGTRQPELPPGYDYDYINAESLLTRARVKNGRLAMPNGPAYRLLVLPPMETMRPELLRKLRDLVEAGATILGPPPKRSPSLQNYPTCDAEVRRLAAELWGDCDGRRVTEHALGQGRVCYGADLAAVLQRLGATPAVMVPKEILWTQRHSDAAEIFFVSNQKSAPVLVNASFRVAGRTPEIWRADSGRIENTAWFAPEGDRTRVPVALDAHGSAFIVFRKPLTAPAVVAVQKDHQPLSGACPIGVERAADGRLLATVTQAGVYQLTSSSGQQMTLNATQLPAPRVVAGPWQLRFPAGSGAPEKIELAQLVLWNEHADAAVRHFSGTATYTTTLTVPADFLRADHQLQLDLGRVEMLAEVSLNGHDLGVLWKPPYALDITAAAQPGANTLQVKVTNNWWNRLAGDATLPEKQRTTFTTSAPRTPREHLLPSGLSGPVVLRAAQTSEVR
ncbi:MAG: glycoside hydrolase family 2 [Verrucomicrobia bacterium]|nr:MAG: glycoside hydrolase family 2 [Verrucomicrobiota bacterium]